MDWGRKGRESIFRFSFTFFFFSFFFTFSNLSRHMRSKDFLCINLPHFSTEKSDFRRNAIAYFANLCRKCKSLFMIWSSEFPAHIKLHVYWVYYSSWWTPSQTWAAFLIPFMPSPRFSVPSLWRQNSFMSSLQNSPNLTAEVALCLSSQNISLLKWNQ